MTGRDSSQNSADTAVDHNAVIRVSQRSGSCGVQPDVVAVDLSIIGSTADNHANVGVAGDDVPIGGCRPTDDIVVATPDIQPVAVSHGHRACGIRSNIVPLDRIAGTRDVDRILSKTLDHEPADRAVI